MSLVDKANLIIYRIREKGLEVFLVNEDKNSEYGWSIPQGRINDQAKAVALLENNQAIPLEPVKNIAGDEENALAVEGDWHDIPSLKSLIKEDAVFMTDTIKEMIPNLENKGAYFAVKEAFKKVLPSQYEFLKELKDIIKERNSTKYM